MAWWKARRKAAPGRQADDETPDPRVWSAAEADSLYQQAIQLAREPGGGDEAERVSAAAVAAAMARGQLPSAAVPDALDAAAQAVAVRREVLDLA
jgi:hypothetical protein